MSSADPGEDAPRAATASESTRDDAAAGETRRDDTAGRETTRDDTARGDTTRDDAARAETTRGPATGEPAAPPAGTAPPREPDAMSRGYARSRAKTEAIQAQLEPLGPDERPLGIKLATALAAFIAVANLVAAAFGAGGESPATGVAFAVLMAAVAAGLWMRRYLIILLFQALLALSIIVSTLSLAFASNILGVLLALTVIGLCSPVFWLLVRVMARLQVPPE